MVQQYQHEHFCSHISLSLSLSLSLTHTHTHTSHLFFLRSALFQGSSYGSPTTIRQTNCVVLPYCEGIDTFHAFDTLIGAVNQARRNARDYVTDVSLEKVDDSLNSNTNERDWV